MGVRSKAHHKGKWMASTPRESLVHQTPDDGHWQHAHHWRDPAKIERRRALKLEAAQRAEARRDTNIEAAKMRRVLLDCGPCVSATFIDGAVHEFREKRLAEIEKHGLKYVRWIEGIKQAETRRISAILDFARVRGILEIGKFLAFETDETADVACTRLKAFSGIYSTANH